MTIADSPYRLSEKRRAVARSTVADLRERRPMESAEPNAGDRAMAMALCRRAERALERSEGASEAALQRVKEAAALLEEALASSEPALTKRVEALSDALLDLT